MLRKLMLVVNPFSGRGLSKSALGSIITRMCDSGYTVTVFTPGEYGIEELTIEHSPHFDLIVCVGGDGTLSYVVSGLLKSGANIPVGYIPAGTANDVATTLALPRNPLTAAHAVITGKPVPLDVGRFGDRYFVYIAAFGAFTGVSYSTPQSAKRALGHLAYVWGGITSVAAIEARHTIIEHDGGIIEGDFIFGGVTNSTSVAGLVRLAPSQVDLADGLFEVILVRQPINMADFMEILSSIIMRNYTSDNIQLFHARRVKFTFDCDVPWTIDGEDGGAHREIEITNRKEAISVIL